VTRSLGKLHYGWVVVATTFVVLVVSAGIRAAPGVLIVPLEEEFHWSRATISFAIGINILLYGLVGPFAAALMDRFGVRRTTTTALALTAAGVALSPLMHQSWQLIALWGVVVGAGSGVFGAFLAAYIPARWFHLRQGLVVGVLMASNAAGQLVFLPTLASLVTHMGWRVMSIALAGTALAFVPLVALLMRDRPEDLGLAPYGADHTVRTPPPADGNPIAVAFTALAAGARSRDFWLIAGSYFICGASTNGLIGTHLIPACVDHGLAEVSGAGLLAATGVFSFIGGTLSGWLSDRWDNRLLLAWYYGLRGLSLLYLPFAFDMSFYGLTLFSVFYGLDWIAGGPADCAASHPGSRHRESRDHGRMDHGHPSGRRRIGGLSRRRAADFLRHLPRSLFPGRPAVLCRCFDGAADRPRQTRRGARARCHSSAVNGAAGRARCRRQARSRLGCRRCWSLS
jgi:predicted MFS family arabinose efflux permease